MHIRVHEDRETMGRAAAAEAVAFLQELSAPRVILASAPSQNELLAHLVRASLDWSRVTFFHMDEYLGLGAEHPASFRHYQQEHVLAHVQPRIFHGLRGEATEDESHRYAALLAEAPIDLVCLGIGENGHLAFNDPPAVFDDPELVKIVALDEACRQQQVNDGCFPALAEVPTHALTLTIPALLQARRLVAVVPGPRKARAVRDAVEGPLDIACPASILRTHPAATLHLDRASAALL